MTEIVRDGNQIGPGVRFVHRDKGTCTALEAPDERGQFQATYRTFHTDGAPEGHDVTEVFHVGMVAR